MYATVRVRLQGTRRLILGLLAAWLLFASPVFAKKIPPAHPVDLNTATVKELEQLPGVGPRTGFEELFVKGPRTQSGTLYVAASNSLGKPPQYLVTS